MNEALPAWLPARRTLGGFYVLRPLANGALGSVLVAVRIEDKGEDDAERFALKVPAYDASAARTLSEAEFFQMFRAEASALLAIPSHPNLARFVTFDTGSRPKPILVMELVEGENLEHAITSRAIDTTRAFKLLDDVLSGLEAMHSVEVGHLDLKPSNVVLRQGKDAVLVDFGLAGRRIRPGCATGPYGAPEVWAADGSSPNTSPRSADVYAFGCVAFEAFTGEILFQAESEIQQIAMHLSHDGFPDKLRKLAANHQPLAELLFSALRRDPQKRSSVPQLRSELRRLAPTLADAKWPLRH
jgi:serine/threonine protein kinase